MLWLHVCSGSAPFLPCLDSTGPADVSLFCCSLLEALTVFKNPSLVLVFQPERKFGVVVVGVGRAGSVRIRDLRNPHPSSAFLNLIGFVSRWLAFILCLVIRGKTNEVN